MKIELIDKNLTDFEKNEIEKLLARQDKTIESDLEQMWYLMDLVWDDYQCDSSHLNWKNVGDFYSHPVWLLNGLFIEQHDVSMGHRHAISDWIISHGFSNVVDYGGGFGTLARLMAEKSSILKVDIYEPHPSGFGLKRASELENISIVDNLDIAYDCLVSTDVLEHVPDPIKNFSLMIDSVKVGGYLVIANAFYPMIKCHLPQCFHFRHTFDLFASIMGLEIIGNLEGSHATIYRKTKIVQYDWIQLKRLDKLSKLLYTQHKESGPLNVRTKKRLAIEILKNILRPFKKLIFR